MCQNRLDVRLQEGSVKEESESVDSLDIMLHLREGRMTTTEGEVRKVLKGII